MADISSIERRKQERLFRMGGCYVLDFTDPTFSEFFEKHTRRHIDAAIYRERGTSKANRLRGFWATEGNHLVGKVIQALIQYGQAEDCLGDEPGLTDLTEDCWKIAARMLNVTPVAELDALTATADERDFETVAQHMREAIEKNQLKAAQYDRATLEVIPPHQSAPEALREVRQGQSPLRVPPQRLEGRWSTNRLQGL